MAFCLGCRRMRPFDLHSWQLVLIDGQQESVCPECLRPRTTETDAAEQLARAEAGGGGG